MALLVPGEQPHTWIQTIGGAESNVACHLAGLDLRRAWLGAVGADELGNAADIVLVGSDEADAVWGCAQPAEIREVLPEPGTLVVKHGEHGATLIERDTATGKDRAPLFQPALTVVDVVETVGAGDA